MVDDVTSDWCWELQPGAQEMFVKMPHEFTGKNERFKCSAARHWWYHLGDANCKLKSMNLKMKNMKLNMNVIEHLNDSFDQFLLVSCPSS